MQQYAPIPSSTHLKDSITPLNNNIASVASDFSGTAFPTMNLLVGMRCLRTDQNKLYQLKDTTPTWVQIADLSSNLSSQLDALETATATNAATSKATPVDADEIPLVDSESSNGLKKLTWANIKATLVAAFASITGVTGSLKLPAGTTAQRDSTPSAGWMRFNTTFGKPEVYLGSAWGSVGGGATGGGSDAIFNLNGQTVTTDFSIPTGQNAGSFGPVAVANGVVVTIPDGSVWAVV